MYDYQNDNEQLSKGNEIEAFPDGVNISSDFKLHKESLPQWAVDWARNRFNMDAKSVKFYVMDEQEVDDSVALASGNNILVTSGFKNDGTVIKHELTHIYQQAIGTATESNSGDTSLEDEAVQVSKEGEISPAKNQTKNGRYILPREKTNVVQPMMSLTAIMGISALAAAAGFTLFGIGKGIIAGIKWLSKRIKYLRTAKRLHVSVNTVKIVEKTFSKDEYFNQELFEEECKYEEQRRKMRANTSFKSKPSKANNCKKINSEVEKLAYNSEKGYYYIKLSGLTHGFSDRPLELVTEDFKCLFGMEPKDIQDNDYRDYCEFYESTGSFEEVKLSDIMDKWKIIMGELPETPESRDLLRTLLKRTKCFTDMSDEKFKEDRNKISTLLGISPVLKELWVYLNSKVISKVLISTNNFKHIDEFLIALEGLLDGNNELANAKRFYSWNKKLINKVINSACEKLEENAGKRYFDSYIP